MTEQHAAQHEQKVGGQSGWQSLGTPPCELRLEWTLPTGQSFRWRQTSDEPLEFTGMIGQRAVSAPTKLSIAAAV